MADGGGARAAPEGAADDDAPVDGMDVRFPFLPFRVLIAEGAGPEGVGFSVHGWMGRMSDFYHLDFIVQVWPEVSLASRPCFLCVSDLSLAGNLCLQHAIPFKAVIC